jgi:hypothetical protein
MGNGHMGGSTNRRVGTCPMSKFLEPITILYCRYKPIGKHSGVMRGRRDGFENFLVPLNAILGLGDVAQQSHWPPLLDEQMYQIEEFELACHKISNTLLSALSSALISTKSVTFESFHRLHEPSTTTLAMLKYPPISTLDEDQTGHMAHTDVGSLTLLFTTSPGLQVFRDSTSSWIPVIPRPGSLIVNVGDTLSFLSSGKLKSCLHRVRSPLSQCARFSLAFFLRPELTAHFLDQNNREWTGEEWHRTKYRIFRVDNNEQEKSSLLTGKLGFLGEWKDDE